MTAIPHRLAPGGVYPPLHIRLLFAYTVAMAFGFLIAERRLFVVTCTRCRRDVQSGQDEFPFQSVAVECPLSGELRRYLPSEVFLGRPDQLVTRQQRAGGVLGSTQVVTDELLRTLQDCRIAGCRIAGDTTTMRLKGFIIAR